MAYSGGRPQFVANPMNPLSYLQLFPRSVRKYVICYIVFWGFVCVYFIYTGFAVYLFQMAYAAAFGSTAKPLHDILAFFPEVKADASRVTWSHATNSKKLLHESLYGADPVMVMESDVLMKGGGTSQQELLPIMAHPPAIDSDLTFDEYLTTVVTNTSGRHVGIKLDFKAIEVVELCLQKVARVADKLPGPLVVNADILRGPGGPVDKEPIDHRRFLRLHNELTPSALLSIGWTTSGDGGPYRWDHVVAMWELVAKLKPQPPVTYPVRSALLPASLPQLRWLAGVTGGSVTVWTSVAATEALPDARVLRRYRDSLGPDRVFVDLPGFPIESLGNASATGAAAAAFEDPLQWNASLSFRPADWTLATSPPDSTSTAAGPDFGCVAGRPRRLSLQSRLTPPAPTDAAPLRLTGDAHLAASTVLYIVLAGGSLQVNVSRTTLTVVERAGSDAASAVRQNRRVDLKSSSTSGGAGGRVCWYRVAHTPTSLHVEVACYRFSPTTGKLAPDAEPATMSLTGLQPHHVSRGYAPIVSLATDGDDRAGAAEPVAVCHLRLV